MLNVNNFYDGLLTFINHAIKNHFVPHSVRKLFISASTANELLNLLQAYKPEPDPKTVALNWSTDDGNGNSSSNKKVDLDLTLRL